MKSVVKQVIENVDGEIQTKNGVFYNHFIEFEDGTKGKYFSKSDKCEKFVAGQEAEFELQKTPHGNKIKPAMSGGGWAGKRSESSEPIELRVATMSIAYAKDILVARKEMTYDELFNMGNQIFDWIINKVKSNNTKQTTQEQSGGDQSAEAYNENNLCVDCHAPYGKPHAKGCKYA